MVRVSNPGPTSFQWLGSMTEVLLSRSRARESLTGWCRVGILDTGTPRLRVELLEVPKLSVERAGRVRNNHQT